MSNSNGTYTATVTGNGNIDIGTAWNTYTLDLNPYIDGTHNYIGMTIGLKINGSDQGYITDYCQAVNYGTTWEVYGVSIPSSLPAQYSCTGGSSQSGTVTSTTEIRVDFGTRSYSVGVSARTNETQNGSNSGASTSTTGGTVSGGDTKSYGSSITLTATASTYYSFIGWYSSTSTNSASSTSASWTFNVSGGATYYALFVRDYVTVTVEANA